MLSRRLFLGSLGAAVCLNGETKPLKGIFPIMQTPFTLDGKLDMKALAKQVLFLEKTGVHGMVWPQLASEYFDLTKEERFAGMEVVAATGQAAIVLGVQGEDTSTAIEYTKFAEKLNPTALIALPPKEKDNAKVLAYYKAIGEHSTRPLFAQTIGDMSVDFVIGMCRQVPHLRYIKDEAGQTLPRLSEYRNRASDNVQGVFTGGHGKTLLDELARGSAGSMPAAPFAEIYVGAFEAWRDGRKREAWELFSKVSLLINTATAYGIPGLKYLLELRGVLTNSICRSSGKNSILDEEGKSILRQSMEFVKPLLKV